MTSLLIGGYTGDKGSGTGITVVDDNGVTSTVPAESPSWIARNPRLPVLYAVAEVDNGRVHAWSLEDGVPVAELGSSGDTGGSEPAHLSVDSSGKFLITANYSGGNISVHRLNDDGSIGPRTDLVQHSRHGEHPRQAGAHPHMVRVVDNGVLIIDLGGDAIYQYRLGDDGTLELERIISAPAGSGPRHALPVADRYYVTAELSGEVLVYDLDARFLGAVPASMAGGHNQPSELVSNGRYLYVANRGPNTVTVFALDGELPRYVTEVPVGDWPRHIGLDGDLLYVANERSHEVMVLRIDPATGIPALERSIEVPSPTVVLL
ncbi:MAG TPA: beta-propeller fold lactonase family protein [Streptosporangiaceae bacterium]|nr:beta-propeller fold lactonase family protein [Streptosporangiaceae bacterium]